LFQQLAVSQPVYEMRVKIRSASSGLVYSCRSLVSLRTCVSHCIWSFE
jgi:hypothetical protein